MSRPSGTDHGGVDGLLVCLAIPVRDMASDAVTGSCWCPRALVAYSWRISKRDWNMKGVSFRVYLA